MKESDNNMRHTRQRQHHCKCIGAYPALYAAAAIIALCNHSCDTILFPFVKSLPFDNTHPVPSLSRGLISELRGGDSAEINAKILLFGRLQLQSDKYTTADSGDLHTQLIVSCGENTNEARLIQQTSQPWNKNRLLFSCATSLRGGADDDKNDGDSDEESANMHDDSSNDVNLAKHSNSETPETSIVCNDEDDETSSDDRQTHPQSITNGNIGHKPTNKVKEKEGGALHSFLSFFRTPSTSAASAKDDSRATIPATSSRLHKEKVLLPHGPDGRGGGGATAMASQKTAAKSAPENSTNESREKKNTETEFLITSDIAGVSTPPSIDKSNATSKQTKTAQTTEKKSPITSTKRTADSSAFVVPPVSKHRSETDRQLDKKGDHAAATKRDGKDKSKSSTSMDENRQSLETKPVDDAFSSTDLLQNTTSSLTTQLEKTYAMKSSNETLNHAAKSSLSLLNGSLSEEPAVSEMATYVGDYTSSGYWVGIDLLASFGLSTLSDDLKISRVLRPVRKAASKATGLHGFLSGKDNTPIHHRRMNATLENERNKPTIISIDEELGIHDSGAAKAEIIARRVVRPSRRMRRRLENRPPRNGRRWGLRRGGPRNGVINPEYLIVPTLNLDSSPDAMEQRRSTRVEEIDKLIQRGSARLLELQCEKDDLQRSPNPLFNYTKKYDPSANQTFGDVRTSRQFNFPPSDLIKEYIDELVSHGRLVRLNHTELWQSRSDNGMGDDEDEIVGDDLFTPSAPLEARRLYENLDELERGTNRNRNKINPNSGGGSWLLRTGFGRNGGSLGEKLGETIETAAYNGVCSSVMMVLARLLSALHGTNIMSHSDIRLYIEQDPDLPPVDKKFGPPSGDNYAREAIETAIRKGAKKKKKGSKTSTHRHSSRHHGHDLSDDAFIQRDAVVETLISHCQISAPLLKLFPLDWQRAIVGNIITLVTAVVSDFADGLQFQILGHALSFSFKPITEADMIQQIGVGGFRQNHRRANPEAFEAAVWATAQDISESLSFLDGWLEWLERKLGGGILRSQVGNLIARVVLTLIDEVLSGARLDLWSSQANGPRLFAALEYRTSPSSDILNQFEI